MRDATYQTATLYQRRGVQLVQLAQGVARRHNRRDAIALDGGCMEMLADSADHALRIQMGPANVDVVIQLTGLWIPTVTGMPSRQLLNPLSVPDSTRAH